MEQSPRPVRGYRILLGLSTSWGLLGISLNLMFPPDAWQATAGVLMMTQAFCIALAWRRLRETAEDLLPDFLTVFLLFQFLQKMITVLSLLVRAYGAEMDAIAFIFDLQGDIENIYRWKAELVFFAATFLFTLGWLIVEHCHRQRTEVREPPVQALWWIYGLSMALFLAGSATGIAAVAGQADSLFRLLALGSLAVLLGGRSQFAIGRQYSWFSLAALIPLYLFSLRSGMKSEIALVSLPVLLPIIRRLTLPRMGFLLGFMLCVVLFIFPFSNEWRKANWDHWGGTENAGIAEVSSRVFSRWATEGMVTTAGESSAEWLIRGSSADMGGLVMQISDRDGHIGGVPIKGLVYIFIPRLLWPEKPLFSPGAWFTWYLGNAPSPETATSASAMMLGTEMYWMYGLSGVLIGMTLLGVLYAWCWKWLVGMSEKGPIPSAALFVLLATAIRLEEANTLYAISGPITLLVYVYLFHQIQLLTLPRLSGLPAGAR
jgi:hypothetical protein